MKKISFTKKTAGILLAGFVALGAAGCGQSSGKADQTAAAAESTAATASGDLAAAVPEPEEPVTVRAAIMTNGFDHYLAVVGLEYGIYEQYGVNLEVTEYGRGINTIDAVVNGTADLGNMADYATVNRLGNTLHDTDLIIFSEQYGGGVNNGGLYVAPQYADDLSKLDGSEGFLTITGTVSDYYNSVAIEYLGLEESKQNIIQADSLQTQLALALQGDASAIYASGSSATKYEELGWVLAVPTDELRINTYAYFLTTEEYNNTHKEDLAKYLEGSQAAFDYIKENLDEVSKFLEGKIGISAEDFVQNWEAYTSKIGFTEDGAAHLEEMEKWGFAHGSYQEDYDIRSFINTEAAELVFPERVTVEK
ncbi:MAG: hypothetical protein LBQ15_13275 [Clostridium sp.]|jgi:NitT/TauT family transport system substrate-binding protein|nr:hypothetical protein [Clostridium sp.]